jgi:hypothetical protein
MPFTSEKDVADSVKGTKKLSPRKRRQFMHVFNECYKQNGEDGGCYARAWGAVKKSANVKAAKELLSIARRLVK